MGRLLVRFNPMSCPDLECWIKMSKGLFATEQGQDCNIHLSFRGTCTVLALLMQKEGIYSRSAFLVDWNSQKDCLQQACSHVMSVQSSEKILGIQTSAVLHLHEDLQTCTYIHDLLCPCREC